MKVLNQSKKANNYMKRQRKKIEDNAKAHRLLCDLNARMDRLYGFLGKIF